jgi:2-keto-4-pentenoate hydratase/2-oxohepta-3-ene-1,7-dioic acid hydratase in catechol pathway
VSDSARTASTIGRFGLATIEEDGGLLRSAVMTERGVLPLAQLFGAEAPLSVRGLLGDWDGWCDRIADALDALHGSDPGWIAPAEVSFAAPLPDPSNMYLAGANYHDHVAEMMTYASAMRSGAADEPAEAVFHFMVPSTSLVGTGHDVVRPKGAENLDWEVELAVVIGRRADKVAAQDGLAYVAGYAVAHDVSVRGPQTMHPIFGVRFIEAKGQATLTPMGPMIVPARFVPDPQNLTLSTRVNGELRQDSSTKQMMSTVAEQIAILSDRAPLIPGDIIFTGTPAGTAAAYGSFLADGDVVTMTVEGLGILENTITGTPA